MPDDTPWMNDPDFKNLPLAEKHKFLLQADPDYKGLPAKEQAKALDAIHYGSLGQISGEGISTKGAGTAAWNTIKGMVPPSPTGPVLSKEFWLGKENPSFEPSKGGLVQAGREASAEYQRATAAGTNPLAAGYSAAISGAGPLVGISDLEQQNLAQQGEGGQILGQSAVPAAVALAGPLVGKAIPKGFSEAIAAKEPSPLTTATPGSAIAAKSAPVFNIGAADWALSPGKSALKYGANKAARAIGMKGYLTAAQEAAGKRAAAEGKAANKLSQQYAEAAEKEAKAQAAAARKGAAKPPPFAPTATSTRDIGPGAFVPQESRNLTPFQPITEGTMTKTAPYAEIPGVTPPPPAPSPIITPEGMTAQPAPVKGGKTSVLARGRQPIPLGVEPDMNNPAHAKIINDEIGQGLNEKKLDELRVRARMDDRFAKFLLNYWTRNRQ